MFFKNFKTLKLKILKMDLIDKILIYLRDIIEKKISARMYKRQEKLNQRAKKEDSPALLYRGY